MSADNERRARELLSAMESAIDNPMSSMLKLSLGSWCESLRTIVAALQEAPADFIDPNSRNFKEGFSVGQIVGRDQVRSQYPPCLRCGAETASQAETMCCMAGDEDNCHGCELWTEDERINSTAPVATTRHDAGFEPGPLFTPDEWDRLRALPKGTHLYTRPDPPVANDVLYADAAETREREDRAMSDKTERLLSELRNKGRAVWTHPNRQDLANRIGEAITAMEAENARLRAMLERASPFLHDEGDKWEDDGSNEPLELARDIDAVLASVSSDESALPSANLVLDGGTDAAYPCPHADEAACDCDSPPSRSIDAARGEKGQ